MRNGKRRTTAAAVLVAGLLLTSGLRSARAQTVTPVASLKLSTLEGSWYELERLPNKAQKRCVADAFVLIAESEKATRLQVVDTCKNTNGAIEARNETLERQDKHGTDGKLKVPFLFFFSHKRWVVAMGPKIEWVALGSANRKQLWVLSRTATVEPELLAKINATVAAQGFNVSKLVQVKQGRPTAGARSIRK